MVHQNQFSRLPFENLNIHISILVDNCGTVKDNGIDQNEIRLWLSPFYLRDQAQA